MPDSPDSQRDQLGSTSRKISRRRFGQDAALGGAFSLATVAASLATEGCGHAPSAGHEAAAAKDAAATEVEAKLGNIIRKFGDRLSPEQRAHLRRILTYNEKMLASIRAFTLQNGDPPASVLRISFAADTASSGAAHSSTSAESHSLDAAQEPS